MKYQCSICGYIYDDAEEGTPFAELPEDWQCPLCGAPKSAFVPMEQESVKPAPQPSVKKVESIQPIDTDMQQLSVGQMAALCSNLARGCEKQYMPEQQAEFQKLAEWFTAHTPKVADATVEKIAAQLKQDIADYPVVKQTAADEGDRGAQRVCVWGEKVTRMLSALMERYEKEGDAMLQDNEIWVCSVCGFVYIGKQAPEVCPVCKVPAWKFDKIERRNK